MHQMCHDQEPLTKFAEEGREDGGGVKTAKKMTKNEPTKPLWRSEIINFTQLLCFYICNN